MKDISELSQEHINARASTWGINYEALIGLVLYRQNEKIEVWRD